MEGGASELTNMTRPIDIRLKVKGMETLYDSFQDYVAVKALSGECGYQTAEFGLQDARAAVTFQSLPPVLCLQLKRYEYNVQRDTIVRVRIISWTGYWCGSNITPKINDRFEFPLEIDLDEFLDETADRTELWKYKLHSVLVHSGDTYGGHNYAFIKPGLSTRWLKFDDDRVIPTAALEVLERNYSGGSPNGAVPQTQKDRPMVIKKSTSADILVYIREAANDEIMAPFTEEDTPPHLGGLILCWWSEIRCSFYSRTEVESRVCPDGGEGGKQCSLVPTIDRQNRHR